MKLTSVLCRKRKMIHKSASAVRNWKWNNEWYRSQERPIKNLRIKEVLEERSIPIYQLQDIMTPIVPPDPALENFQMPQKLKLEKQEQDESHPYWQEEEAFTYGARSWQPKDCELNHAQAVTNTLSVDSLPRQLLKNIENTQLTAADEERIKKSLISCYVGDATQTKLPRNWKPEYTGWHPVESTMVPRNQYDTTAFSWGWKTNREYGIPLTRKLGNLNRALYKEICKTRNISFANNHFLDKNEVRQFVRAPNGKLLRYYLAIPFMSTGSSPLPNYEVTMPQGTCVPETLPLEPQVGFKPTNIYQHINNFPVLSMKNSHPFVHTVVYNDTDFITKKYNPDKQRAKCLLYAYATALGQARLIHGEGIIGDLDTPITVNSVSTNGQNFTFGSFQLNSTDLNSSKPNLFSYHPDTQDLFEFCGYDNGRVSLKNFDAETLRFLGGLLVNPISSASNKQKISAAN